MSLKLIALGATHEDKKRLAYVQLTSGKYFIYKDSATLTTDSVVVTTSLIETVSGTGTSYFGSYLYNSENYSLVLSKILPAPTRIWLTGKADALFSPNNSIYMRPKEVNHDGYYFRYPPCNCGDEKYIPSMIVEGKTYNDVILTSGFIQNSIPQYFSYYWSKGVGLIKRSENNNGISKTYTLLRNN